MANAPRLKLDRKLIAWVVVGVLAVFVLVLFVAKGPDLGKAKIDKSKQDKQLEAAAKALQARVDDPAAATKSALVKAEKARVDAPKMPALPPETPLQQRAAQMELDRYERAARTIYPNGRVSAQSSFSRGGMASGGVPGAPSASGGAAFVMYNVDSGNGTGGPRQAGGAVPLYRPAPAPVGVAQARPTVQAAQQKKAPSALDAPLIAAHDDAVMLAKTDKTAVRANGEYWIAPGTVINGVLLSAVDTQLPGSITARVTQDIYDSRYGTQLVIPAGSVLRGNYKSAVQDGQDRVFMAFDTLVTPSGGIVSLGNMSASDALGRAGVEGDLHTHFWKRMGISTLLALETVEMDRLSPQQYTGTLMGTTVSPMMDGAQVIVNTANQELQRQYSVKPNITINAGQLLTIVTTGSIEVPPIANTR